MYMCAYKQWPVRVVEICSPERTALVINADASQAEAKKIARR